MDDNLAEFREISKPALLDKLEQLSIHGNKGKNIYHIT